MVVLSAGAVNAQAPLKVGHINSSKLLDTLPSRKEAIKTLEDFGRRGEQELQEMEAELQKAVMVYQKNPPTSPTMVQFEEEKLQKKQMALQQREQELQQQMSLLSNELNAPILKRMQKSVDIVAERKKLNYIIDESQAIYSKGGTDLTSEVMVELLRLDREETKTTGSAKTTGSTETPPPPPVAVPKSK